MGRVNKRKKRVQAKGEYIGKINIFCAKIDDKYRGLPKNRKKSETENQPKITEPPKINQKKKQGRKHSNRYDDEKLFIRTAYEQNGKQKL